MPKQKKRSKQKETAQSKPQPAKQEAKTVENPPKTSPEKPPGHTW
jgi:hypothetical protein